MQFEVTDYGVQGGRLDSSGRGCRPGRAGSGRARAHRRLRLESGCRTRKHLKGDLLNLQDAGVALGMIVLAGVNRSDDSLRRFATTLVNRPGPRVLVWTEEDLNALAAEQPPWDGTESGAYQRAPESESSFGIA